MLSMMIIMVKGQTAHESAPGVVWFWLLYEFAGLRLLTSYHAIVSVSRATLRRNHPVVCCLEDRKSKLFIHRNSSCRFPEPSLESLLYEARGQRLRQTRLTKQNRSILEIHHHNDDSNQNLRNRCSCGRETTNA
jgi:hypothetical protein